MRLLICSTYGHLPDVVGGLQTSTDEFCLALAERGIEAVVLCGVGADDADTPLPPQDDTSLGYRVIRVDDPAAALPALAAQITPDVIIVQTGPGMSALLLASLDTGCATAAYFHNVELHSIGGYLIAHPSLLYIANSQFTADRLRVAYGIDCVILPPLILPERYSGTAAGDRVLFVNPFPHKGVQIAFAIAQARPHLPFTFVESWDVSPVLRDLMQQRAQALSNVEWLRSTRDVRGLLSRARVLLMPSVWEEAYGRTAVEAQLSGVPVLASDRGGLPEAVGSGGIVLDPHAPLDLWLAALDQLYQQRAQWAEQARDHAQEVILSGRVALDTTLTRLMLHAAANTSSAGRPAPADR